MTKPEHKSIHPKRARDLTIEARRKLIGRLDWSTNLSDASLSRLVENCVALDFRRRRFVYRAGNPADSLFAIAYGRVKLCRIEETSGREAVIDILSEGSL